MVIKPISV